jgi:hypothetical protein
MLAVYNTIVNSDHWDSLQKRLTASPGYGETRGYKYGSYPQEIVSISSYQ